MHSDDSICTATAQFADLSRVFSLRILKIESQDRSSFDDVVDFCCNHIAAWRSRSPSASAQAPAASIQRPPHRRRARNPVRRAPPPEARRAGGAQSKPPPCRPVD